jgi:hypothetical protein
MMFCEISFYPTNHQLNAEKSEGGVWGFVPCLGLPARYVFMYGSRGFKLSTLIVKYTVGSG